MKRLILIGLICLSLSSAGVFAQEDRIFALVWSPDGTQLAVATRYQFSVFDVSNGDARLRWQTITEKPINLVWSPDGTQLAVATRYQFSVFDVGNGDARLRWQTITEKPINSLIFNPSGSWIAVALGDENKVNDGYIGIWNARSGAQVTWFAADEFATYQLAFSTDSSRLVDISSVVGRLFATKVWDTRTWKEIPTPISGRSSAVVPVFSPNGQYLAFGYWRSSVVFLNPETYEVEAIVHEARNNCIVFNEDASQVILGFQSSLQMWAIRTQPELYLVRQSLWQSEPGDRSQEVVGCSTNHFATSSYDGTLRIYNTITAQIEQIYQDHGSVIRIATFNPDGSQLAFVNETAGSTSAGDGQFNNRVAIWNWNSHSEPRYLILNEE